MPKVYLTKQDKLNDRLAEKIYGVMKVKRISQRQIAKELGISQQAFSKKLRSVQFTFSDLVTIFEVLEIPDEDILSIMRMRERGKI